MPLAESLRDLKNTMSRMTTGKGWESIRDRFGILGQGWLVETTYSEDRGWHPHLHVYFFSRNDFDKNSVQPVAKALSEKWVGSATSVGAVASTFAQSVELIDPATARRATAYLLKDSPKFRSKKDGVHCAGDIFDAATSGTPEAIYASPLWAEFEEATFRKQRFRFSTNLDEKLPSTVRFR
ncbi:hypothetical protein [Subtercola boreus]|uniref:hypothetical protein n=1 Tax=Subtercola boreus TaxID=120213 RepID=UPI00114EF550|nr:hypothetical protein [Subtercola boreus]